MEEAVEDAVGEGNGRGGEERGVFVGIEPSLGFAGRDFGEESGWEGVLRDEPEREDGHFADAVKELRDVAARGGRAFGGEGTHDGFGVVEGEAVDRDFADEGIDVELEAAGVVFGGAFLFDMVYPFGLLHHGVARGCCVTFRRDAAA
ncbi:hypothetical protein [Polyangium sp. y55x31]|uniref:hypothetical protein n=1 Tax=Polyangium sp. y55x31 TaxID=3042688 RepID=UPI0024822A62|nr:hypothetical protein [Polyangium sp. y55x31]MDI1481488.1 hypothetical protein [Polyangium sp. y55x31]